MSVASGRYQTASEVVRAALRLLERLDAGEPQSGTAKNAYPRRRITPGDGKTSKTSLDDGNDGSGERVKKGTGHGSIAKVPRHA